MSLQIQLAQCLEPTPPFRQNIFRFAPDGDAGLILTLALTLPIRHPGDIRPASQRQRDTLAGFFWGLDLLPSDFGSQQAGRLMDMRALAFAVAETMEDGFLAAHRKQIAPMIASYISRSAYLTAVARGWNRGAKDKTQSSDSLQWQLLVTAPFYKELIEFGLLAREDLSRDIARDDD